MKINRRVTFHTILLTIVLMAAAAWTKTTTQSSMYHRLSDKHRSVVWHQLKAVQGMSLLECGIWCLKTGLECDAFATTDLNDCVTLAIAPNITEAPWVCPSVSCDIFYTAQGFESEMMVFRLRSGQDIPFLTAWTNALAPNVTPAEVSEALNLNDPFHRTFYRHPIIDIWGDLDISKVILSLYTNNTEGLRLELNGTDTNSTNWFSMSNLISSPWTDLDTDVYFFTFTQTRIDLHRRLYINTNFPGCDFDVGWLVVLDDEDMCVYSKYPEYPVFVYATGSERQNWNNMDKFGTADDLVISIRLRL